MSRKTAAWGTRAGVTRSLGRPAFFDYTFHVRARLRRFLLMLLMLTLPVQALAYAAMQGCAHPYPGAVESGVQGQMAMAGCHEAGDPAGAPSQHLPAQHDCKFCAACALASAVLAFFGLRPAVVEEKLPGHLEPAE